MYNIVTFLTKKKKKKKKLKICLFMVFNIFSKKIDADNNINTFLHTTLYKNKCSIL